MVDWSVIVGDVITQVLRVIIPVLVALVLKWAVEVWAKVKTEKPDLAAVLDYAVDLAVHAAEQIFGEGAGEQKKAYAIEAVERFLAERGVFIDVDVIADAIEAEVYKDFNALKLLDVAEVTDEPSEITFEEVKDD